jgi:CRISPR/Cas system-associated exonuclease Cas4 (RecB family)
MFEYIYVDGLSGKTPLPELRKKIQNGVDFHILAERYFNGMDDYFYVEDPKLLEWMARFEEKYPKTLNCRSEYEMKQNKDGISLMAKYDLLVVEDNKIKIIDFKTNEKEYDKDKIEKNIQTKVYMFLLGENLKKFFKKMELEDISMEYFQLNFPKNKIVIKYNEKKHKKNKEYLKNIIKKIEENKKSFYIKNTKTCEKCGFVSFCGKL